MKRFNQLLMTLGVVVSLCMGVSSALAQNDNGGDNAAGGNAGGGNRNNRGNRGGGQGGNFDPAQMQQRMMDNVKGQLGYTNDSDWTAVEPLVQKVMDARREVAAGGMSRMFGRGNRGGQGGQTAGRGGAFGTPNPEAEALQKALDDNAPAAQVKDLLKKYQASQKTKQAKLEKAQADLRAVLTTRQEAQATLLGLVN
jgi:hypothetical protein